jgi:hypothetical protein
LGPTVFGVFAFPGLVTSSSSAQAVTIAAMLVLAAYGAGFAALAAWRYRADQARPLG